MLDSQRHRGKALSRRLDIVFAHYCRFLFNGKVPKEAAMSEVCVSLDRGILAYLEQVMAARRSNAPCRAGYRR